MCFPFERLVSSSASLLQATLVSGIAANAFSASVAITGWLMADVHSFNRAKVCRKIPHFCCQVEKNQSLQWVSAICWTNGRHIFGDSCERAHSQIGGNLNWLYVFSFAEKIAAVEQISCFATSSTVAETLSVLQSGRRNLLFIFLKKGHLLPTSTFLWLVFKR